MIRIGAGSLFGSGGDQRGHIVLRKIHLFLIALIVFYGCAKVQHIDQLLTLKGLADEQVVMGEYVEQQDQKFEMMVKEFKAGTLEQYLNKRKILRTFGEPIYIKHISKNEEEIETWLYRYSTEFFDSEKIYLYFDTDDNLVESQYKGKGDGEIR